MRDALTATTTGASSQYFSMDGDESVSVVGVPPPGLGELRGLAGKVGMEGPSSIEYLVLDAPVLQATEEVEEDRRLAELVAHGLPCWLAAPFVQEQVIVQERVQQRTIELIAGSGVVRVKEQTADVPVP